MRRWGDRLYGPMRRWGYRLYGPMRRWGYRLYGPMRVADITDLEQVDLILERLVSVAVAVEEVHHLHGVQLPLLVVHLPILGHWL